MWEVTQARLRAAAVSFPALLVLGLLVVPGPKHSESAAALIAQAVDDPTGWQWGWFLAATGITFELISLIAIRSYLRSAGENLWSFLAVPLIIVGFSALMYTQASASSLAAAIEAGASGQAMLEASGGPPMALIYAPVLLLGTPGWVCLIVGIWRSHILSRAMTWTVALASIARFLTSTSQVDWIALYGLRLSIFLFYAPLAWRMWIDSSKAAVVGRTAEP